MGITIHYSGKLRSTDEMPAIRAIASKWAKRWKCEVHDIDDPWKKLFRVRSGKADFYESPVTGTRLHPHPKSETLVFELDSDLYMQHFCKTQFAPVQVHIDIVEMLREMETHFEQFSVNDESGYWETGDRGKLEQNITFISNVIDKVSNNDAALLAPYLHVQVDPKDPLKDPVTSLN